MVPKAMIVSISMAEQPPMRIQLSQVGNLLAHLHTRYGHTIRHPDNGHTTILNKVRPTDLVMGQPQKL